MRITLSTLIVLLLLAGGCAPDTLDQATPQDPNDPEIYLQQAEAMLAENDTPPLDFRAQPILVNVGDDLQAAVDAAGPGTTLMLAPGVHTPGGTVTISERIRITGQPGAIVEADSDDTAGFPFQVDPVFHVLNTRWVLIENLTIRDADQSGSTGILVEDADFTRIRNNSIEYFELGIAHYQGLGTRINDNHIMGKTALRGVGIVNVAGRLLMIYDNTVTNNLNNVFVGDGPGVLQRNTLTTTDGGGIGILLCTPNIGGNYLILPSGESVAAPASANRWFLIRNYSENHRWNYLVIDNANNNYLINNDAANAVLLDIEMAGDSERFGFFTPTSFGNKAFSSAHPGVTVKVCGVNNQAIGGTQIDTNEFPCD